ncbi:chaperone modulator CbpM [Pseudofrankia inefficax]|uniref:MerR family transcriptional regulator n=1 Tax=Pseudofrankia inefficax (strain DSM 45817 / CECT 9037 / DDB 130130 / EuI1c) TaxID=298654 RepID=E3J764_PSEI1|nr:chaperone modulator CbpM [Pseudofrankia inefficax]ADP84428.1 hypothetical protein FraEuI1c_6447 [Pseudofrankia inefficax]
MSTRCQPESGGSRPDASRRYPLALVRRPRRGTVSARSQAQPRFGVANWLTLETVADRAGLHPELVRQFATLSLLDTSRDAAGTLWFPPDAPATIARIRRLRAGLGLNYAAIGLVLDLLDRIDALEAALGGSTSPRVRSVLEASNARSGRLWT